MSNFVTYTITPLAGSTAATNDAAIALLDNRFAQTQNYLNDLSGRIETLGTKSAIIRQNVPLATNVAAGNLVYYNTTNAQYELAQALTLAETTQSGQTIEAPQARVEGIILDTHAGDNTFTGTMLCGGYWKDDTFALMNTCLGNSASPGIYYLSPATPGKATLNTYGHLRQPVLSYYGDGSFCMTIFYMAHDNHYHASQKLTGTWETVAGGTYTDVPYGAQRVYGGTYSYGIGSIGDTTALFSNGVLQDTITGSTTAPFVISGGNIWYRGTDVPTDVTIFNHYPFAYDTSIVRTIVSSNDALTVTNTNGLVEITANDFEDGDISRSSYAVASIDGNKLNYTPVVTGVMAGPGINVVNSADGNAYISTATQVGALMDAYSINHNGTTLISNGSSLQYITFPASRISNFVMVMPVTGINSPCSMSVWAMKLGTVSANLTITAYFIPDATSTTASTINVNRENAVMSISAGSDADALVYGEAAISGCTVSGSGLLVASVSVTSAPQTQIQLLRTGFKLDVIGSTVGATIGEGSITQTLTVGANAISAGTAVMISDGVLVACTNTKTELSDNTNKCVGVAMHDAGAGEPLTYMITGTMLLTVEDAEPGQSLYIDTTGALTVVNDVEAFMATARFLQKVGTAVTANQIQVNIESAVKGDA